MGRVGVAPVVGGGQLPRELHSRHAQTLEPNPGAGSSTALELLGNLANVPGISFSTRLSLSLRDWSDGGAHVYGLLYDGRDPPGLWRQRKAG